VRGLGVGEEIVEQADGVLPFERDAVEREPSFVRRDVWGDQRGGEEGVEAG